MKKLVFMYIEENCGFYRQGFNFSTRERFCVDRKIEEKLCLRKISYERVLPDNFWGNNISEISLLVGENGSGKTTLMRIICQWICGLSQNIFPQEKGILVFQNEDALGYIAFSEGKEVDIIADIPKVDLSFFFNDLKIIYFSNTMTEMSLSDFDILMDYSMSRRLKEANAYKEIVSGNPMTEYKQYEFIRQVDLVLNGELQVSAHYIQMEVNRLSFEEIGQMLPRECKDSVNDLAELWKYYFYRDNERPCRKEMKLIIELMQAFFCGMIVKMIKLERTIDYRKESISFAEIFRKIILNEKVSGNNRDIGRACRWAQGILKDLVHDCRIEYENYEYNKEYGEKWDSYQKNIDNYFSVIYLFMQQEGASFFEKWREISDYKKENISIWQMELQGNKENFLKFWNVFKKVILSIDGIYFYWDISSGEENKLNLFSILTEISSKDMNIWLLLDEPDNTFHPDWSKGLIKEIKEFCEKYKNRVFQTWISTHSPLLLSDIPTPAAIYLKNDEVRKRKMVLLPDRDTFGQNIYILYNDAFFLKNGVIGDFASDKIVEFVLKLEDLEKKIIENQGTYESLYECIVECEKVSALIAEPVFKQQMEYYLRSSKRLVKKVREKRNE